MSIPRRSRNSRIGALIQGRRARTINPLTGFPYTQPELAAAASRLAGFAIQRSHIASIEAGRSSQPPPEVLHPICTVLGLSVTEALHAMGYELESLPAGQPDETELTVLYRALSQPARDALLVWARQLTDLERTYHPASVA